MSGIDTILQNVDTLAKEQKVRTFDIYALGPFLLYVATRKGALGAWSRRTLFVAGCMTIVYNWNKYKTMKTDLESALKDAHVLA